MNLITECYDKMSNEIKTNNNKKKEVSNSNKSLKISHRKKYFRYKPY